MFLRVMIVLLGIIGLAGIGLVAVIELQQRPAPPVAVAVAPPPAPVTKRMILVAARPLHAGNLMVSEDVMGIEAPPDGDPPGSFVDSIASRTELRGAMVRRSIGSGEPILAADVINPGDRGFLAAVLGAGMRAVSVAVDAVSGTAGLIWPGDHVDLVLTQEIEDRDQPSDHRVSGETVLINLRVIAVDQQLVEGGQAQLTTVASTNRTVTIEANPYDAERIAVASRLGRISLVVRSAADIEAVDAKAGPATAADTPPVAWAGDVSPALRERPVNKTGDSIHLYHGPGAVDEVKF